MSASRTRFRSRVKLDLYSSSIPVPQQIEDTLFVDRFSVEAFGYGPGHSGIFRLHAAVGLLFQGYEYLFTFLNVEGLQRDDGSVSNPGLYSLSPNPPKG